MMFGNKFLVNGNSVLWKKVFEHINLQLIK